MRDDTLDMLEKRVRLPSNEKVDEFMNESEETGGRTGRRQRSKKPGARMLAGPIVESSDWIDDAECVACILGLVNKVINSWWTQLMTIFGSATIKHYKCN